MKYLSIDITAAKEIVSQRSYQSTEYREGELLCSIIKGGLNEEEFNFGFNVSSSSSGITLFGYTPSLNKLMIFDLELFDGFKKCNDSDTLLMLQKVCRTAIKYWEAIPFGSREWNVNDTDFVVLIPKSFSRGSSSKIIIDVKPDQNRQERRDSKHILVFYYGEEEVGKPSTTNYKKAVEESKKLKNFKDESSTETTAPMMVSKLDSNFTPIDATTSLEAWNKLLTKKQLDFVLRNNLGPERIEGAAGTGKTLSLSLRCCNIINNFIDNGEPLKASFITHSQASKEYIQDIILPKIKKTKGSNTSLSVITLQEWCIDSLGNKVEETELLDKDAQNSKDYQGILISDALDEFESSIISHSKFISEELKAFLNNKDHALKIQSLQYEIAEVIKGRSSQDLEKYKKIGSQGHALPIVTEADYECIYHLYSHYQKKLEDTGYFDSDDIIISALGQLDSPIWRRRKNREGYDIIFIDETHLFNINELSVIHHLLKDESSSNVIYSFDKSQSVGSLSLDSIELDGFLKNAENNSINLKTVFRSSPDIVRFAFSVLASGSALFTNLENPLDRIEDSFTDQDEKRAKKPYAVGLDSDEDVITQSFTFADKLAKELDTKRCNIVIIATTDNIFNSLERFAVDNNKPAEFIKRRGDKSIQNLAKKGGKYIISGIDYVGGLEFDGAVIIGADKGHLPATEENNIDSRHFLNHASYNRTYVAITRAKYGVSVIFSKARGLSPILEFPVIEDNLELIN